MSPHSIILCALLALLPLASWAGQTPEEVKKDVATIRLKAELGNADAQFNLGACYSCGLSVLPKDEAEAVKWYRKAAEQGHVGAQYNLGNCYSYGLGVPKDEAEAVKWYRKAAEQGHAMSQGYITSWAGMTPKEVQTFDDARLKAGKGDADAQYMLGMCYSDGKGVPKDKAEAVKWFRKAA
jgi:TPR repeat protein